MTGPSTSRAMAWTASKSPGDAIGKPASMTSTPSRASWCAISSFSAVFSEIPGDCSPSRRVVSKRMTLQSRLQVVEPPTGGTEAKSAGRARTPSVGQSTQVPWRAAFSHRMRALLLAVAALFVAAATVSAHPSAPEHGRCLLQVGRAEQPDVLGGDEERARPGSSRREPCTEEARTVHARRQDARPRGHQPAPLPVQPAPDGVQLADRGPGRASRTSRSARWTSRATSPSWRPPIRSPASCSSTSRT